MNIEEAKIALQKLMVRKVKEKGGEVNAYKNGLIHGLWLAFEILDRK